VTPFLLVGYVLGVQALAEHGNPGFLTGSVSITAFGMRMGFYNRCIRVGLTGQSWGEIGDRHAAGVRADRAADRRPSPRCASGTRRPSAQKCTQHLFDASHRDMASPPARDGEHQLEKARQPAPTEDPAGSAGADRAMSRRSQSGMVGRLSSPVDQLVGRVCTDRVPLWDVSHNGLVSVLRARLATAGAPPSRTAAGS
jgi:hypothetical protein